ncbi:Vacuolar iron transporter homolog 4 [Linum grandiflorum]
MALSSTSKFTPPSDLELAIPPTQTHEPGKQGEATTMDAIIPVDYSKRAQWLRAAVLGANDGLLSTSSLMMGIGAVHKDSTTMVLTGLAGLVAGACSMAIGEFVSVYSQHDIQVAQLDREFKSSVISRDVYVARKKKEVPSPTKAALASGIAFAVGAMVPLLGAAFVKEYIIRIWLVVGLASLALFGFGWLSAFLGGAPVLKSSVRVLVGGWFAMAVTFGLTKAIGSAAGI